MKIKKEHFNHIKNLVDAFTADPENREKLENHKAKVSSMRYRHDVARAAGMSSQWVCDNLYPYMDDTHLDTALRNIVRS